MKNEGINVENLIHVQRSKLPARSAKNLKISLVNTCSIRNKTTDISEYVVNSNIDVCLMTETWLKSRDAVIRAELKPTGYNFKDSPRPSGRVGGGVGIMFKSGIKCKLLSSGALKSMEYANYELLFEKSKLDVHVIYRPPYSSKLRVTTGTFFEEFQTYLSGAVQSPYSLLITGDFNIHVNDDNNSDHIRLRNLFCMYDLVQHVHVPTHKSGNTLDLIVTRSNDELLLSDPVADYM